MRSLSDLANESDDNIELDWHEAIYRVVRRIPEGKVVTYGQAADNVPGISVTARQVGAALRDAPVDVPWQRVVGAGGRLPISKRSPYLESLQRTLLAGEGVPFLARAHDTVDMAAAQLRSVDREYHADAGTENAAP